VADTPPAMQIFVIPVAGMPVVNLFNKMEMIRPCMDAQMSVKFSSINLDWRLYAPAKIKDSGFNPLKLKLSPGIVGSGNVKRLGFPVVHICQSVVRRGRVVPTTWQIYQCFTGCIVYVSPDHFCIDGDSHNMIWYARHLQ